MRTDIRFAGIAAHWTESYAKIYCEKILEMGWCARVMSNNTDDGFFVVYAHRPFCRKEASEVAINLGFFKPKEGKEEE